MLDKLSPQTSNIPKKYRSAATSLGLVLSMFTSGVAQDVVISQKNDLINKTDSERLTILLKEKLEELPLDLVITTSSMINNDESPSLSNDKELILKMGSLSNGKYRFQVWKQGPEGYPIIDEELSVKYRDAIKSYRLSDGDSSYTSNEITKGISDFVDQLVKQESQDKHEDIVEEQGGIKKNMGIWSAIALGIGSMSAALLTYLRRKKKNITAIEQEISQDHTIQDTIKENDDNTKIIQDESMAQDETLNPIKSKKINTSKKRLSKSQQIIRSMFDSIDIEDQEKTRQLYDILIETSKNKVLIDNIKKVQSDKKRGQLGGKFGSHSFYNLLYYIFGSTKTMQDKIDIINKRGNIPLDQDEIKSIIEYCSTLDIS